MALKLIIDKLEDADENLRALYVESDGRFHLDVDGFDRLRDAESVEREISAATRKANKEAEQERLKRKRWENLGRTPEEIEDLLAAQAKAEEEKLTKAGEFEKIKALMLAKAADDLKAERAKIEAKDAEIAAMRRSLENHLIDAQATAAIAAAKGKAKVLLPHVRNQVRVEEKDGNYSIQVVDSKGEPRFNGKDGGPLTLSDVIAEMRASEDFGGNFEGSGQSGSGTQPGNGGGIPQHNVKGRSELKTEKERAAFVDQNGLAAYQALPA